MNPISTASSQIDWDSIGRLAIDEALGAYKQIDLDPIGFHWLLSKYPINENQIAFYSRVNQIWNSCQQSDDEHSPLDLEKHSFSLKLPGQILKTYLVFSKYLPIDDEEMVMKVLGYCKKLDELFLLDSKISNFKIRIPAIVQKYINQFLVDRQIQAYPEIFFMLKNFCVKPGEFFKRFPEVFVTRISKNLYYRLCVKRGYSARYSYDMVIDELGKYLQISQSNPRDAKQYPDLAEVLKDYSSAKLLRFRESRASFREHVILPQRPVYPILTCEAIEMFLNPEIPSKNYSSIILKSLLHEETIYPVMDMIENFRSNLDKHVQEILFQKGKKLAKIELMIAVFNSKVPTGLKIENCIQEMIAKELDLILTRYEQIISKLVNKYCNNKDTEGQLSNRNVSFSETGNYKFFSRYDPPKVVNDVSENECPQISPFQEFPKFTYDQTIDEYIRENLSITFIEDTFEFHIKNTCPELANNALKKIKFIFNRSLLEIVDKCTQGKILPRAAVKDFFQSILYTIKQNISVSEYDDEEFAISVGCLLDPTQSDTEIRLSDHREYELVLKYKESLTQKASYQEENEEKKKDSLPKKWRLERFLFTSSELEKINPVLKLISQDIDYQEILFKLFRQFAQIKE